MKTLIIYDNEGKIFTKITGDYLNPVGLQHLEIELENGKTIDFIDVTAIPHRVVLKDIPKSELEIVNERMVATEEALLQLILEGGM